MTKKLVLAAVVCSFNILSAGAEIPKVNLVVDSSQLKWSEAVPGVTLAVAHGDPKRGASHFFLKYAAGLKTPSHHHTAEHFVTLVSGTMLLTVDGAEHKLSPGSFFHMKAGAKHVAACEGAADCVMSIDSRGAWDVVPEKK